MYNTKDVAFLLDPKDSVQAYEEAGKMNKKESQYEKGMKALASLEHVQQLTAIEGKITELKLYYSAWRVRQQWYYIPLTWNYLSTLLEYNNMKERLMQYLQKFAENKKVVREEDIKEFFSGMESKKRARVVVPTYCR